MRRVALALSRKHHPGPARPAARPSVVRAGPGRRQRARIRRCGAAVESALAAALEAGSSPTRWSRSRRAGAARCGRCARTSPKRSGAKARTSSTTSRCRSRRSPPSSTHARVALDAALPGVRFVVFGHLGDGNLHYNLSAPAGVAPRDFLAHARRAPTASSTTSSRAHGGSFSAEHGIGQLKRDELVRYKSAGRARADAQRSRPRSIRPASSIPGKVL